MTQATTTSKPEFYRLPQTGPDPFFGLSKAKYYQLEKEGRIKLTRLRERGKLRGTTLVQFDMMSDFFRSLSDTAAPAAAAPAAGGAN